MPLQKIYYHQKKKMENNSIEIVICTEGNGYLESMSKLLISSLREFGGDFKDVPIFSYQPRKQFKVSQETIDFFEKNKVEYVDLELNKDFGNYPLANKLLASAHREQNTKAEILIFLDSDVLFFNEPKEFADFGSADVILRPVDMKNIGSENSEDENAGYWESLYKLLNVKVRRKVSTTVTNESIWEYYQGGHQISLTKNNLFSTANENFIKVMEVGIIPNSGSTFIEQSVFAATVSQMELKVKLLGKKYNYPIHMENEIINSDYLVSNFDSLVSIHYHDIFKRKNVNIARFIMQKINQIPQGKKVNEMIKSCYQFL